MIRKMKLLILAALICSTLTVNLKALSQGHTLNENKDILIDYYYVFDDWYYSYTPVYYTYTPTSYYYLCEWWWFPSACNTTYIVWRKNELKNSKDAGKDTKIEKREINADEAKNQIKQLKKEIFGKEEFSTEDIRKNNKAYDPRWLLAQLKISRLLFLEDEVNKNKKVVFENTSSPVSQAESKKEEKKD